MFEGERTPNFNNVQIRIDDEPPFAPEYFGKVGILRGYVETTEPGDGVKNYKVKSSVAIVEYIYIEREYVLYFREGEWKTTPDGLPLFHVRGLLNG